MRKLYNKRIQKASQKTKKQFMPSLLTYKLFFVQQLNRAIIEKHHFLSIKLKKIKFSHIIFHKTYL